MNASNSNFVKTRTTARAKFAQDLNGNSDSGECRGGKDEVHGQHGVKAGTKNNWRRRANMKRMSKEYVPEGTISSLGVLL